MDEQTAHDQGWAQVPPEAELPPMWPKVVGWIGLSYALLQLGCGGCGGVLLMMPTLMSGFMQQSFPDGVPPVVLAPPLTAWIGLGMSVCVQLVLVAAALALILRKPFARPMHLLYASLAIVAAVFGIWAQMQYQADIDAWIAQNPNTRYAQAQSGTGAQLGKYFGWAVTLVLGLGWPFFCLVWFGAVKRSSDEIERGVEQLM